MKEKGEIRHRGELRNRKRGEMRMGAEHQHEDTERMKTFVINGVLVEAKSRKEAEHIFYELTGVEFDDGED